MLSLTPHFSEVTEAITRLQNRLNGFAWRSAPVHRAKAAVLMTANEDRANPARALSNRMRTLAFT